MFSEYLERGFSVIPVNPKGKNPVLKDWQKYCNELPTYEETSRWDKVEYNIGVACGPSSGIVVVDIDTDDKDILNACPLSPVVRRGQKGEARFFKYNENIRSQSIPFIDILSTGRQILIPPSIHPITEKPYRWLSVDTLENFDVNDLPDLDLSFLSKLENKLKKVPKITNTGRNNKLVDIVTSMRSRGESEGLIVTEIYNWDKDFHNPRLFLDSSEGFKGKDENDAKMNAWRFVNNVTRSLIENGVISIGSENIMVTVSDEKVMPIYKALEFPRPSGIMNKIMKMIEDYSERDMPNLALGGAISLMSAVCSNRFRFNDTWTNTYVLNLAPTGGGKSFPQRIVKKILDEKLESGLLGFGNYKSSSALVKNLKSRRERLDIIDEVASLFAQIKSGGLYQMEILDELCKLWSDSNGKYLAGEYAEKDDTASCYNPCVSILGSSTIEGIKATISKTTIAKGLIPRFLIFSHEDYGRIKEDFFNYALLDEITLDLGMIMEIPRRESSQKVDRLQGPLYDPINLAPTNADALKYFKNLKLEFAKVLESDMPESIKHMMTRGKEQVMKLSVLHAVSNSRFDQVILEDLVWAKDVFDVCIHNSRMFIEETNADNSYEKDLMQVLGIIQRKGKATLKIIQNRLPRLTVRSMNDILAHLCQMEKIQKVTMKHPANGKLSEVFVIAEHLTEKQ